MIPRSGLIWMASMLFCVVLPTAFFPSDASCGTNVWTKLSTGLDGGDIWSIAVDPLNPNTIYAGAANAGIFKSTNAGSNWVSASSGLPNYPYTMAIVIDPKQTSTLYAATYGAGVYRSVDGGTNWTARNGGLTDNNYINALVINPTTTTTLYAGTSKGLFKSTNSGSDWIAANTGLPAGSIKALVIDPQTPSTLYAGTGSGLYKTINSGGNWTQLTNGIPTLNIPAAALCAQTPSTLFAGLNDGRVFKTWDGGATWIPTGMAADNDAVVMVWVTPTSDQHVFVSKQSGSVFSTSNGGTTWSNAGQTGPAPILHAISFNPQVVRTGYAATGAGVVRTTDGGNTWVVANTGLSAMPVASIAIDPLNPSNLYIATPAGGVHKSTNKGQNWAAANTGLLGYNSSAIAINPVEPATLFAAGIAGISKSTNSGQSWSTARAGNYFDALAMNPKSTQIIYAGARSTGILKSTDGGTNWAPANTGLVNLDIEALVIDPQNPLTLYAGGYPNISPNGVYRTTDGGDHWTKLNKGLGNLDFQALAVDPVSPMNVYAGTTAGLYKSIDRGENWQELNTGLVTKHILSLTVHPQNSSVVYAGAWGEGVVVSNDGGNIWASLNAGLTNLNITSLAIDPKSPSTVYAGTLASGIFVITADLTPSAQVSALRQVDGASAGATAKLEAQIKNTGILPLSADSNVRFYVEGPNMPINWAGSTSTAGLAPGATQWYSFNWPIPANASAGRYTYYAEVWQSSAISQRSTGMGFDVTRTGPPGKAALISPNGTISTATPAYVWNAVPTATWYRLYVNDSAAPPARVDKWYAAGQAGCSSGTGTCSVTPSDALSAGAAQWWIQAWSDAGTGPWSDGLTFAVAGGGPPGKATLISPNGAISTTTPAYSWNAVSGATWYLLWVNSTAGSGVINKWYSAEQSNCASGTGTCGVTPSIPVAAGNAQWWIQTWNNAGYGQWSDGMSFTVGGGGVPGKATLVTPNGTISTGTPAYVWNAVAGSTWYRLWVGSSSGAGIIDAWYTAEQAGCASGTGTCSVTPATAVPAGAAQWWIRTWNSSGDGPWSDGMSFSVVAGQ